MAERIEFTGSQGDRLAARLDLPPRTPEAYAIFAHCFTCSKDVAAASRVSRALAEGGIGVLRFDFTGLGHSDGEFANTNFSSNVDDVVNAARSEVSIRSRLTPREAERLRAAPSGPEAEGA